MTPEEKKQKAQERKEAKRLKELEIQQRYEQSVQAWKAGYKDRVLEFRNLIKSAGLTEDLFVTSDLEIHIRVGVEESYVDGVYYRYDETYMTSETLEWEYESMKSRIVEYIDAKKAYDEIVAEARAFKQSLTPHQLKLLKYF